MILDLVVLPVLGYDFAECLVRLPLFDLAVAGAVPLVFALGAPLSGDLTAVGALGVLHELLEHVRIVKLHDSFHVFLKLVLVWTEELASLVIRDVFPIAVFHDARTVLRDSLHYKTIFLSNRILLGHRKFLKGSEQVSQNRHLIERGLI